VSFWKLEENGGVMQKKAEIHGSTVDSICVSSGGLVVSSGRSLRGSDVHRL
jgi:hypothetical protein